MAKPAEDPVDRFPAMRSSEFRWLFANGFFTTGSRWAQILARGWLVHDLSGGSTAAVGWVTFASFIPFVFVGPVAGAMADRFQRRRVLISGGVFGVAGAAALAVCTALDVVQVWHVGVLAFATGSAQAITVPTRQALVATSVPRVHLTNAVALSGLSQHGSRLAGPLFGAAFLSTLGVSAVFGVSAVLLALGVLCAFRVGGETTPVLAQTDGGAAPNGGEAEGAVLTAIRELRGDLSAALRYVVSDRRLLVVIGLVGAHCSLTMAFDSMLPALSDRVGGSEGLYSGVLVALGLGALVGTLGVSQIRNDATRALTFVVSGVGSGLSIMLLGIATGPNVVLPAAVLAGLTQASYMALSATLVQGVVADQFRARVMSLYIMIAAGHMAILNLGFGQLAEILEVRVLLVAPGLLWIVLFLVFIAILPEARSVAVSGQFSHNDPIEDLEGYLLDGG
ncbi:MAG: MFS transporter [Actinomycetota bacterium]|nr:MFS transporter [Acidimicrobiales bacterium]MEC8977230.1 MFS transporter [Actinomycetota bacterium]